MSSLPIWQRGMLVHAFGDTYGHVADDGTLFGNVYGHALVGHSIDYVTYNFPRWRTFVYELYDALGGQNASSNAMLNLIVSTGSSLPYTPSWANDWSSTPPDERTDSLKMGNLAQTSFGYTFAYWPGGALGSPEAVDGIHPRRSQISNAIEA